MFLARIVVNKYEAEYLKGALEREMHLRKNDTLLLERSLVIGKTDLLIESVEPLSLEQRRFLVSCGFQFSTSKM